MINWFRYIQFLVDFGHFESFNLKESNERANLTLGGSLILLAMLSAEEVKVTEIHLRMWVLNTD